MIKYIRSAKFKRKQKRLSKKRHKRSIRSRVKRVGRNIITLRKNKYQRTQINQRTKYKTIPAPEFFSFIEQPEQTIKFINKLENLYLKKSSVFVDLSAIKTLDYSAVAVLISVMFSFKSRNIYFNGNFPTDRRLAKILIDSGFFKYLSRPIGNNIEYTIGKENQIFARANKEVNSELGLIVMAESSTTIWGDKRICKGVQRTLLELMQNTNNHADGCEKGAKHWWLSVNHDKTLKKVSFFFVDYGIGIFESLKTKPTGNKWFGWFEKLKLRLVHGGNDEIFNLLLNGEMHMTVTGQHFRGKGLPGIKEVFDREQISNLCIISNDVYAEVSKNRYMTLSNEFSGTFVSWELNENNINAPWTI